MYGDVCKNDKSRDNSCKERNCPELKKCRKLPAKESNPLGLLGLPSSIVKGIPFYGGLDLASTTDITAWVLVFPPETEGERYQVLCRFFIPGDSIATRVLRDKVPLL
jgi:phage terminase large subunit-like protein